MVRKFKQLAILLAAAGLLTACGGGGGSAPEPVPEIKVKAVKVVGDSLSDSGTMGFKFTVQGNDADGSPYKVWVERIAAQYRLNLCPHYRSQTPEMTAYTEEAACSNYAIGGAKINPVTVSTGAVITTPASIIRQIKDVASAGVSADDLLLVAGGSNDAATLIEYFLGAVAQGNAVPLMLLLRSQIDAATLDALVNKGNDGLIQAGGLYLQNVAKLLAASIRADLLDQGVKRVAILNVPAITMTPEFVAVLKQIEAMQGSAQAEGLRMVFDGWVQAFNATLTASFVDESRVAVVDFYTSFKDQVSNPGKYGFSNSTLPACSVLGVTDDIYNCGAAQLGTHIPQGETSADWWRRYMFSNAFHPTPYGHEQMSLIMANALKSKSWQP